MRVPISWLKDFVDVTISAADLAERLLLVGVAVEGVENRNSGLSGVVAARIESIEKHPDADRLRIAQVNVGDRTLQIVTAASNVQQNDVIPLAIDGATVEKKGPDGTPGLMKITRGKLRGVVSEGMMCSSAELGLTGKDLPEEQRVGVMLLPSDTPLGSDVLKLMGIDEDVLIVEPFANRPDFLSILGIAREVAAVLGVPLKPLKLDFEVTSEQASDLCRVSIQDPDLCTRYVARVIADVDLGPSPLWMQGRLTAAGVRCINRVVDVTNYVMIEVGQPLHAFDYDRLGEQEIRVRRARAGEPMTTLDGEKRLLTESMLVIADAEKAVALAGVMGGLETEVSASTRRILLEAANFHPATVRRTSQALALHSESSRRFEKGLSYENVDVGSRRACVLLSQLGCRVTGGAVDVGTPPPETAPVTLKAGTLERVLGVRIDDEKTRAILESLSFGVERENGGFRVRVPSFRQDVRRDVDLVEEVARHYGYENIPTTLPGGRSLGRTSPMDRNEEWMRDLLARCGLDEAITLSLYREDARARKGFEPGQHVRVHNPLTEDQAVMRSTLLVHLLDALTHNARARRTAVRMFELSKVYLAENDGKSPWSHVNEARRLGVVLWDSSRAGSQGSPTFLEGRGILEVVCREVGVPLELTEALVTGLHPGKTARVLVAGQDIGFIGALHPSTAASLELSGDVVLAELDYAALLEHRKVRRYRGVARFPESSRDLAIVFAEPVKWGEVEKLVRDISGPLLQTVTCFDIYRGDKIAAGHKSMAFRMVFQSSERTLTDAEIEAICTRLVQTLSEKLGGVPRT